MLSVPLRSSAIVWAAFVPDAKFAGGAADPEGVIERAATLAAVAVATAVTERGTLVLRMTDGTELEYPGTSRATIRRACFRPATWRLLQPEYQGSLVRPKAR
jgi:hypothetical protein